MAAHSTRRRMARCMSELLCQQECCAGHALKAATNDAGLNCSCIPPWTAVSGLLQLCVHEGHVMIQLVKGRSGMTLAQFSSSGGGVIAMSKAHTWGTSTTCAGGLKLATTSSCTSRGPMQRSL